MFNIDYIYSSTNAIDPVHIQYEKRSTSLNNSHGISSILDTAQVWLQN